MYLVIRKLPPLFQNILTIDIRAAAAGVSLSLEELHYG
jgi:hypothetical protein